MDWARRIPTGLGFGVALGIALGSATHHVGVWLAIGLAMGAAIDYAARRFPSTPAQYLRNVVRDLRR